MRSLTNLIGIVLIIAGIATLVWQGITYTKQEQIAKIGNVQVTQDTQKTIYVPPVIAGLATVAGLLLVFLARRK